MPSCKHTSLTMLRLLRHASEEGVGMGWVCVDKPKEQQVGSSFASYLTPLHVIQQLRRVSYYI